MDRFLKPACEDKRRKLPSYIQPRDPSIDRRFRPRPDRQVILDDVYEEEIDAEMNGVNIDLTEDDDAETTNDTVAVYLRVRPHPKTDFQAYRVEDNSFVLKRDSIHKYFLFSEIFDDKSTQKQMFQSCVRSHLEDVTEDSGATFLTYGTSGSGKTHTLLGDEVSPGILPRALEQIFVQYETYISSRPIVKIEKREDQVIVLDDYKAQQEIDISNLIVETVSNYDLDLYEQMRSKIQEEHDFHQKDLSHVKQINIWVSFVEIYNENLRDLLDISQGNSHLKIIANDGDSYIKNVQWIFAPTVSDAYKIMKYGQNNISYGTTAINATSSRAHSIFFVNIVTLTEDNEISYSLYKFCDLAGAERVKKAEAQGQRLKETQRINKSLMILGRCLSAVHANQEAKKVTEVVPVRESKFTLLIQSALIGRERLTMIVNILPIPDYFDENLNVLAFSAIAKQIVVRKAEDRKARRCSTKFSSFLQTANTSIVADHKACELERETLLDEIQLYKEEIKRLKDEMFNQEVTLRADIVNGYEDLIKRRMEDHQKKIELVKHNTAKQYEIKLEQLKRKYDNLAEDYDEIEDQVEAVEDERDKLQTLVTELRSKLSHYENQEENIKKANGSER